MAANTEDIAEKVADLLLNQGLNAAQMATRVVPEILAGTNDAGTGLLASAAAHLKNRKDLQDLLSLSGEVSMPRINEILHKFGEKASSVYVSDSDSKDYEKLLLDQGVLYAKIDKTDDNCKMFVFLSKDEEKVQAASQILMARRGMVSELRPDLYFNSLSPDKVHITEGLNVSEMELYRHYVREKGILFTAIAGKDGYTLVTNKKDEMASREALLKTAWALTGKTGALIAEQIKDRLEGKRALQRACEEKNTELYIVSRDTPDSYIHIDEEGFSIFKKGNKVSSVSRSEKDFAAKCIASCENLNNPAILSPSQFRKGLKKEDLKKAKTINLFPDSYDEYREMERLNELKNLVSVKASLDEDNSSTFGISDMSMSYSAFTGLEEHMDDDNEKIWGDDFQHFKESALYTNTKHVHADIDMEEKNLDYLIAKAEEKKKAYQTPKAKEKEEEKSSDKKGMFDFLSH